MNDDELQEALALYALGALEAREAAEVEALLVERPELAAEFRELEAAAAQLVFAAEPVDPPRALREEILDRAVPPVAAPAALRRAPERIRVAKRSLWTPALALAAASALAVAVTLSRRVQELEGTLAAERRSAGELRIQLAAELDRSHFLSRASVIEVRLQGTDQAPAALAKMAIDRESGQAWLFVENLPMPPRGMEYQLWSIPGSTPIPGATFGLAEGGEAALTDRIPLEGRDAEVFAVTLEPAGGGPAPTGEIFLVAQQS